LFIKELKNEEKNLIKEPNEKMNVNAFNV